MKNLYDNLEVDIKALHDRIDKEERHPYRQGYYLAGMSGLLRFIVIKGMIKIGIFQRLVDAGIIRGWFRLFKKYWQEELGGRPLSIHDFHFLRCYYRMKFQGVEVQENSSVERFSYAWQRTENIYSTFDAIYKYSLNPTLSYGYLGYLKRKAKVLEYGCGLASITHSLIKYFSYKQLDFSAADINGFPFHYAKYHLAGYRVKFYNITPYKPVSFNDTYDAIFLMNVLEHLPDPNAVIVQLTNALRKEGILFFDYIKSEGKGLDTKEGLLKRKSVLDYILKNYKVIKGKVEVDNNIGLTIVSKL